MPLLRDRQFLVESHDSAVDFRPEKSAVYVSGKSSEPRALHARTWQQGSRDFATVQIAETTAYSFKAEWDGETGEYSLRSVEHLAAFWSRCSGRLVYLDVTGLSHHIWAPLLRAGLKSRRQFMVIYVEPDHYQFSVTPTEGEIFDLSERISGIAPIPGFANLGDADGESVCFVPLLGFEGIRLAHILEQVQPPSSKIIPIVGVPGFKPEYPFHTYHGNHRSLLDTRAWKNARFASANNPFSVFYALEDIASLYPRARLKIAPIGTKPHAVGAILFALASPKPVELVYDHPIRKAGRTGGSGRLFVYDVSTFMRV